MTVNDTLVAFTLLITIITLLVGVMAYLEFGKLRSLRQELQGSKPNCANNYFAPRRPSSESSPVTASLILSGGLRC